MIRPLLFFASTACLGGAQEFQAIVLEMPNEKADAWVKQVKEEKTTPWKGLVNEQGTPLDDKAVKLIARLKVAQEKERSASQVVKEEASKTLTRHYGYRVTPGKEGQPPSRNISIFLMPTEDEKAHRLDLWAIDLAASVGGHWTFSARHRKKETSRIVLEKTSEPTEGVKEDRWFSLRLIEAKSTVARRTEKLGRNEFAVNPDEFYRTEWRYPEGRWHLVQEDTVTPRQSVIDAADSGLSIGQGERITFSVREMGIESDIDVRRNFEFKGKKRSYFSTGWPYERDDRVKLPPFAMQKVLAESKVVFKDGTGINMGRASRSSTITGEAIAE
jgi:hypothetical protein